MSFPVRPTTTPPAARRTMWRESAIVMAVFVAILYIVEAINSASSNSLVHDGIVPRTASGLDGIAFAPLLHANWDHLFANTIPLVILGFLVLVTGLARGLAATAIIWVIGGFGTWLTANSYSVTVGASGVIFGWLAFLLVRGIFARNVGQLALGLVVFVVYGGLLWGVLPNDPTVSWQGHLFGAVGGVIAAWVLSSKAHTAKTA